MDYQIKDPEMLRKLLWFDTVLGGGTAIIGLIFYAELTIILGLSTRFILVVSAITSLYSVVALRLATQKKVSISLLRLLVGANWLWTLVSLVLLFTHYSKAKFLGVIFLLVQVVVVAGLAYLEGNQLVKNRDMRL